MMIEYPKYMHRAPDERVIADDHFQERNYIAAGYSPGAAVDRDTTSRKGRGPTAARPRF